MTADSEKEPGGDATGKLFPDSVRSGSVPEFWPPLGVFVSVISGEHESLITFHWASMTKDLHGGLLEKGFIQTSVMIFERSHVMPISRSLFFILDSSGAT